MTTQTINLKPLQRLQDLLSESNDAKILNYVKTEIAENLNTYISLGEEFSRIEIQYKQLRLEGLNRTIAYNEAMKQLSAILDESLERMNIK